MNLTQKKIKESTNYATPGVDTIWSPKWLAVAFLYLASTALMAHDPWFGDRHFEWTQGVILLVLTFVIISTLCFEWNLMGRSTGINLILQLSLMVPFALFLGRIIGRPYNYTSMDGMLGDIIFKVKYFVNDLGIFNWLPEPIQELFSSPSLTIFTLCIFLGLSLSRKKTVRIGFLITALILPLLIEIASPPHLSFQFFIGLLLMLAGISIQFIDVNESISDLNILSNLKHVNDEAERRASIRIIKRTIKDGLINEQIVLEIIRRCYSDQHGFDLNTVPFIARTISQRLVYEHGLLDVNLSSNGYYLTPSQNLFTYESSLTGVALLPRNIILCSIAILWWISPIDLIPDGIPIIGSVDDVIILFLGSSPLIKQIKLDKKNTYLQGQRGSFT